jgi:hypothetical protein
VNLTSTEKSLKEKILKEMVADQKNALERNFELAKSFVEPTPEGKVNVLVRSNPKLDAKYNLQLYMIGKLYAKEAELCESEAVSNQEFAKELGMPDGTVKSALKELRDSNKINQVSPGLHSIKSNLIEKILKDVESKTG